MLSNKYLICAAIVLITALSSGCSVTPTKPSSLNYYDSTGIRSGKAKQSFDNEITYPYHFDDVFDATYKALFRKGFQIEKEDRISGVLLGKAYLRTPGATVARPYTAFVMIKELSSKPRTKLSIKVDLHWDISYSSLGLDAYAEQTGSSIVSDIQAILSTYE